MKSMGEWRKVNTRNTILNIIRSEGKASKFQLQKTTRYSMTTILAAIDELSDEKLIISGGKGISQGGRRPEYFVLNPEGGFFIGVEFNALNISAAVINFKGETVVTRSRRFNNGVMNQALLTQEVVDLLNDLYLPLVNSRKRVFGIGIGSPSLIDFKQVTTYSDLSQAPDLPIQRAIERNFGLPVYLDHNVNAIALALRTLVDDHQNEDFVLFSIRKGVHTSIFINGQLLRGRNNSAGEIGHIPVPGNKRQCVCGHYGCIDTLASNEGILNILREGVRGNRYQKLFNTIDRDESKLTITSFADSVLAGHNDSRLLFEEICDYLAYGLTGVVNILNPTKVILYGELMRVGDLLANSLLERLNRMAFYTNARNLQIICSEYDPEIGAVGAATLVLNNMFPYIKTIEAAEFNFRRY